MTQITWTGLLLLALCANAQAQERIYRCGNVYTNTVTQAQAKNCKLVEGANVTVVQGTRPSQAKASVPASAASAASAGPRVNTQEQKSRDSDARLILQSELKKAEARHAELLKEYNNGEPERLGNETRNYQRYLDRVAELKASLARNESDMAGIRRELERLPASPAGR
jgi:hypothetical protein